ncbi:hypothetical protein LCGC14_1361580 [marine sediment metagenome]|uniref:Radical SAM core domain-containing protein n=1 Tax=marine sediment metagenome TaxID=412755 RepID=A0A0F9K8N5_9ZZZZ
MSRMFSVPTPEGSKIMRTWNVHVGCDFLCTYCNARRTALTRLRNSPRYKDGFTPHLVRSEYKRRFKPGDFVFIGYMGDISFCSLPIIRDLCRVIWEQPEVNFLFCTKSPLHYHHWYWHIVWPENLYLGATIETNRDYHLTRAPAPLYRYIAMRALDHPKKFLSIEPICDFDLDEMLSWITEIDPQIIEVGADNYHNDLPEPPWEKVEKLLAYLRANFPTVVEKAGLVRLKSG